MLIGVRSGITSTSDPAISAVSRQDTPARFGGEDGTLGSAVRALIDGLPGPVAVTTADWRILIANRAWIERAEDEQRCALLSIGHNFRYYWLWLQMTGMAGAQDAIDQLDQFSAGGGSQAQVHDREDEQHRFCLSRFDFLDGRYTIVARSNAGEVERLRRQNRALNVSLMKAETRLVQVHEDERLRLARDLHDTAAQHLIGMNLMLGKMKVMATDVVSAKAVADLSDLLSQFHKDLRGLTYLLHPPQIEEHGLHGAIARLCEGFAQRTGLSIDARIYGKDRRRNSPAEGAAYRIVQEALSNVHRHPRASRVRVRLSDRPDALYVSVLDDGRGLSGRGSHHVSPDIVVGVGIAGMIGRAAELGGMLRLQAQKGRSGTAVVACLPRDGGGRSFIPPAG